MKNRDIFHNIDLLPPDISAKLGVVECEKHSTFNVALKERNFQNGFPHDCGQQLVDFTKCSLTFPIAVVVVFSLILLLNELLSSSSTSISFPNDSRDISAERIANSKFSYQ